MTAYSFKYFEENAGRIVKEASVNDEMITVTFDDGESVVIMPSSKAAGLDETERLSANPANRRHILASIEEYRQGRVVHKSLDDLVATQEL